MRTTDKIRTVLNILFLIGFIVTIVLYITDEGGKEYLYAGITTLSVKMAEFILRFVY